MLPGAWAQHFRSVKIVHGLLAVSTPIFNNFELTGIPRCHHGFVFKISSIQSFHIQKCIRPVKP